MQKYVPINKRSKKEQKKFYAMQRRTWDGLSPMTRTKESGKVYNRKKMGREFKELPVFLCPCVAFLYFASELFRK